MATLNDINLTNNTRWSNEFEGSAIESQQKWTEDGRQFLFQKHKQKFRKIVYECGWQSYATVKQLELIRNSGQAAVLTHNDNRVFTVILESIDTKPLKETNQHANSSRFITTLNFIEI